MALFAEHFSVASPLSPAEIVARLRPLVLAEPAPLTRAWFGFTGDFRFGGEVAESSLRLHGVGTSRNILHQFLDAQIEQTPNGSDVHCRIGPPAVSLVFCAMAAAACGLLSCCGLSAIPSAVQGKTDWSTVIGPVSGALVFIAVFFQSWTLGRAERAALRTFVTTELSHPLN